MGRKRIEEQGTARRCRCSIQTRAAIDVGATMHMAAVNAGSHALSRYAASVPSPLICIGWLSGFAKCGVDTVVMESTSVLLDPDL